MPQETPKSRGQVVVHMKTWGGDRFHNKKAILFAFRFLSTMIKGGGVGGGGCFCF